MENRNKCSTHFKNTLISSVFSAILLLPISLNSSIVTFSLKELCVISTDIVIVEVTDVVRPLYDDKRLETYSKNKFRIVKSMKGALTEGDEINYRTYSEGVPPLSGTPVPRFYKGEKAILFLGRNRSTNSLHLPISAQFAFKIIKHPETGLDIVQRDLVDFQLDILNKKPSSIKDKVIRAKINRKVSLPEKFQKFNNTLNVKPGGNVLLKDFVELIDFFLKN